MKKIFILFLVIFIGLGRAAGQLDTIHYPSPQYYKKTLWTEDTVQLMRGYRLTHIFFNVNAHTEMAKVFYTKDTLKVYGAAAAWYIGSTEWDYGRPINRENWKYLDTALDHVFEYYKILEPDGTGGFNDVATTKVYATTPPAAYVRFLPEYPVGENRRIIPRRILEAYFDQPVTVIDTFYVGFTQYMDNDCVIIDGVQWWKTRSMEHLIPDRCIGWEADIPAEHMDTVYENSNYCYWTPYRYMLFLFPIYNPEEVHHDGIETPRGIARYVTVSPNPAKDKAQVISSFPLIGVEVYDLTGRKVYGQAASGPSTWMDISSWPTGTYMVKVNTSMGEVTKKLQVQ